MNKLPILISSVSLILIIGIVLGISAQENNIPSWIKNTAKWWSDDSVTDSEYLNSIEYLAEKRIINIQTPPLPPKDCSGNAGCIPGVVTKIFDGDTIEVYGKSVRFAITSTPEVYDPQGKLTQEEIEKGIKAKEFVEELCPVGSAVLIDEDDLQTHGSYDRIVGVVYCNGVNLNEEVLASGHGWTSSTFCNKEKSEFATHLWAQTYGC